MKTRLVIFFSVFIYGLAFSQVPFDIKREVARVPSSEYNQDKTVEVYLPTGYEEIKSENLKLDVIYVLDGNWQALANYIATISGFIHQAGESSARDFLIVAVYQDNRNDDFVDNPIRFTKFLKNELFPYIEKKYFVTQYRLGIGHSLGATYLTNLLAENQSLFHSYILLSPNYEINNYDIINKIENLYKKSSKINSFINVSVGDEGWDKHFTMGVRKLDSLTQIYKPKGLYYHFDYVEGSHTSNLINELPQALKRYNSIFNFGEKDAEKLLESGNKNIYNAFISHLQNISKWSGKDFEPTVNDLNIFANFCLDHKLYEDGLKFIDLSLSKFPNVLDVFYTKSQIILNSNNSIEAKKVLDFALSELEKKKENIDVLYYDYYKKLFEQGIEEIKSR